MREARHRRVKVEEEGKGRVGRVDKGKEEEEEEEEERKKERGRDRVAWWLNG
jgi:hypothetical protein